MRNGKGRAGAIESLERQATGGEKREEGLLIGWMSLGEAVVLLDSAIEEFRGLPGAGGLEPKGSGKGMGAGAAEFVEALERGIQVAGFQVA